jgi:hypothetical protein
MEYLLVIMFAVAVAVVAVNAWKPEWLEPVKKLINKK